MKTPLVTGTLALLLLALGLPAAAQVFPPVKNPDSLTALIEAAAVHDSVKIQNLILLAKWELDRGDEARSLQRIRQAKEKALLLGRPDLLADVYHKWSRLFYDTETMDFLLGEMKTLIPRIPELSEQAAAPFLSFCIMLEFTERFADELETLSLIEEQFKKRKEPYRLLSKLENVRSQLFSTLKDKENAVRHAALAVEYAEKSGNQSLVWTCRYVEISILHILKLFDAANEKTLKIWNGNDTIPEAFKGHFVYLLFNGLMEEERYAEALGFAEAYVASSGSALDSVFNLANLATCHWKAGSPDPARRLFGLAAEILEREHSTDRYYRSNRAHFEMHLGEFAMSQGDFAGAAEMLQRAAGAFRADDDFIYREENYWRTLKAAAEASRRSGDLEGATAMQQELIESMQREKEKQAGLEGIFTAARLQDEQRKAQVQLLELRNRQQRLILWGVGAGLLVALTLGGVIWRQSALLAVEKKKSEALLLNMLPGAIAERMKQGEHSIADYFDEATVVFIDMVGFTGISATVGPEEVVQFLNTIFSTFDRLTEKFGLEKIKTIGDCYMAVSGIPQPAADHLERALDFCLEVLTEVEKCSFGGRPVQFKIGVETGPAVAGVIGEKRFLFDLWGDTVNTASRMESNGLPGVVTVTAQVFQKMKDRYAFRFRGQLDVKGKGPVEVYSLEPTPSLAGHSS